MAKHAEKGRLLLVEDELLVAEVVRTLLEQQGYEVVFADCCAAAYEAGGTFPVGIFDLGLPDGDGAALAAELLGAGRVVQAVFYTGSLPPPQAERLGQVVQKADGAAPLLAAVRRANEPSDPPARP